MHEYLSPEDVIEGTARIVRCPECGQFEIWSLDELMDHGWCRSAGIPCPECAEAYLEAQFGRGEEARP